MRKWLRIGSIFGMVVGLMLAMIAPASATIHEIVASFCADSHETSSPTTDLHDPPGLSGFSSADNVAQPLLASGAFEFTRTDVDGDGDMESALVIDEDAPQVKLSGSGDFFQDPMSGVYVEIGTTEGSDFPAFARCANLRE